MNLIDVSILNKKMFVSISIEFEFFSYKYSFNVPTRVFRLFPPLGENKKIKTPLNSPKFTTFPQIFSFTSIYIDSISILEI